MRYVLAFIIFLLATPALAQTLTYDTGIIVKPQSYFFTTGNSNGNQCTTGRVGRVQGTSTTYVCITGRWERYDLEYCSPDPPSGSCDYRDVCVSTVGNKFWFCKANVWTSTTTAVSSTFDTNSDGVDDVALVDDGIDADVDGTWDMATDVKYELDCLAGNAEQHMARGWEDGFLTCNQNNCGISKGSGTANGNAGYGFGHGASSDSSIFRNLDYDGTNAETASCGGIGGGNYILASYNQAKWYMAQVRYFSALVKSNIEDADSGSYHRIGFVRRPNAAVNEVEQLGQRNGAFFACSNNQDTDGDTVGECSNPASPTDADDCRWWTFTCTDSDTPSCTRKDTGLTCVAATADTSYHLYEIRYDGSSWRFYRDRTLVTTHTSSDNVPGATGQGAIAGYVIEQDANSPSTPTSFNVKKMVLWLTGD